MKSLLALGLMALLLSGCRQEDWREVEVALPEGMAPTVAVERVMALDTQTPPKVTVEGGRVKVRYNSMHMAIKNIEYALR